MLQQSIFTLKDNQNKVVGNFQELVLHTTKQCHNKREEDWVHSL